MSMPPRPRRFRALAALPVAALVLLAGCDFSGASDPVSGFWAGTA